MMFSVFTFSYSEDEPQNIDNIIKNVISEYKEINIKEDYSQYFNDFLKKTQEDLEEEPLNNNELNQASLVYVLDNMPVIVNELNAEKPHDLASITKIMTALITLEQVRLKKIKLSDKVYFKEQDLKIGGSLVKSNTKTPHTVKQLLEALLVYSGNNAAYALARYVGKGSIDSFVAMMNEKAQSLYMMSTHYYTPSGLPTSYTKQKNDVSTPFDQAILMEYILNNYKELLEIAQTKSIVFDGIRYMNRNKILYTGYNIGVKTGYHSKAGYNMVGLFLEDGIYTIVVTFGDKNEKERFNNQINLYNQARPYINSIIENKNTDKKD